MDANAQAMLDLILNAVKTIIAVAGLGYGIYQLWDGFSNDQPQEKKKGIVVLIVTVVAFVALTAAKPIIIGLMG